jgi:hypothetical protein
MAGERLYSEFTDHYGDDWRVSIYDTNGAWNPDNAESFRLGGEGFILKYSGANEQQYQPIIASSLEFTLYEENADHTQTLDLLYSFPEGRLIVEVYRDPDGDNEIYWRGVILAEQVERADEDFPTAVRLTASDDLGNLKDVDFSLDLGDVGGSGLQVIKQLVRCLGGLRTYSRWVDGEPIIRYINDTELHSSEDDTDPLGEIIAQTPVKVLDDGTSEAYSCYDILSSLASCFNARVFLAEGVFYFWPLNVHKRVSDNEGIQSIIKQYDKDADNIIWTIADTIDFAGKVKRIAGTDYDKLRGHVFTHLPPVKSVERTRRYSGNMYVVRGNDDTVITSGQNITLADTDRTYELGTKLRISGFVEFQVSPDAGFDFGLPESRVHIEVELMLKVGNRYYQPEQWTTDSSDRYVIDVSSFDRSNGANINTSYSFVTDELPAELVGLDCTAVVKFFNEEAPAVNVTSSYTSEDFFIDFGVEIVDGTGTNGDLITYRATHTSDNVLELDQGEILFGDNVSFSAQGKLYDLDGSLNRVENDWKSSQTAGPLPIHRLGVEEALSRQKYATKIHRGTLTDIVEMYMTLVDNSEFYVPFEMSTNMNRRESTVERYKIAYDNSGITSADDPPRSDGILRDGVLDLINSSVLTVTQQVQQPKLTAGGFPDDFTAGRAMQQVSSVGPLFHRIKLIEHSGGAIHEILTEHQTYMYMNTYVDTANGTGNIRLPRVGENEGRMFRFKSDGTISSTKNYRIVLQADEQTAGVRIDGQTSFAMDRDYDGIAVVCYDGQWYVIQRKSK